ncbi:hypothetical protein [Niallia sp. Krafla_26]|uniref:hypothetical protein n=1 Tax=Niallia sp. Krafla_26 TaxID=3064703 RepID=UPI003D183AF0
MNLFKRLFNKNDATKHHRKTEFSEELRLKVDDYFAYLLTIYNNYVEQYNQNKAIRDSINKNLDVEAYLRNMDNGIRLTKKASEHIKTSPYVYEIPKSVGQFMSASRTQFLLSLENYIERDELIKRILTQQVDDRLAMDDANELLAKADQHLNSAMNYMEKTRDLVYSIES